jgi:hypothetical protein
MLSTGFEAAIPANKLPLIYALDRKVAGISNAKIDQ